MAGRSPGVWEWELRREVFRFFRVAGARLPRRLRVEIVRAILAGPKGKVRRSLRPEFVPREKALRLHRLSSSGVQLNKDSKTLLQQAGLTVQSGLDERDEFAVWQEEGGWISNEEFAPRDLIQGSIADVVSAVEEGRIGRDEYHGLVLRKPDKAAAALRGLADRGKWPAPIWQGFLWGLPRQREQQERYFPFEDVARLLAAAPGRVVRGCRFCRCGFHQGVGRGMRYRPRTGTSDTLGKGLERSR